MTNDRAANEIKVYDGESQTLVQTLSTHGTGGVAGVPDGNGVAVLSPRIEDQN